MQPWCKYPIVIICFYIYRRQREYITHICCMMHVMILYTMWCNKTCRVIQWWYEELVRQTWRAASIRTDYLSSWVQTIVVLEVKLTYCTNCRTRVKESDCKWDDEIAFGKTNIFVIKTAILSGSFYGSYTWNYKGNDTGRQSMNV